MQNSCRGKKQIWYKTEDHTTLCHRHLVNCCMRKIACEKASNRWMTLFNRPYHSVLADCLISALFLRQRTRLLIHNLGKSHTLHNSRININLATVCHIPSYGSQKNFKHVKWPSRSPKVTDIGDIHLVKYDFLSEFHCNYLAYQRGHDGSETLHQPNPPVLKRDAGYCRLIRMTAVSKCNL